MSTAIPTYIRIKDLAARTLVSEKTIRREIDAGELAAVQLRGQIRITEEAALKWLEAQKVTPINRKPRGGEHVASNTEKNSFRQMAS